MVVNDVVSTPSPVPPATVYTAQTVFPQMSHPLFPLATPVPVPVVAPTPHPLSTGYYSTSYNRVVNSITSSTQSLVLRNRGGREATAPGVSNGVVGAIGKGANKYAHLLVREEELQKMYADILADHPTGRQAH